MARPLRIEFPGACYHVMNRGNQRSRVFHSPAHYELFAHRLGLFAKEFSVRIHCVTLMPNHFHLVVTTDEGNLSRFMQTLLTSFAVNLNRMRRGCGHVFQGRFKALVVEAQLYLSQLSRYIHLNPVRQRGFRSVPLEERREALLSYEWSTFRATIGLAPVPLWLDIEPVLDTWGPSRGEQMRNYRRYVEQGLTADLPNPLLDARKQAILGSDAFVDDLKREHLLQRQADRREELTLAHLQRSFSLAEVCNAVRAVYEVGEGSEPCRSARGEARRALMWSAAVYCRGTRSLSWLAEQFGVSVSGLTKARRRMEQLTATDAEVQGRVARVVGELGVAPPSHITTLSDA